MPGLFAAPVAVPNPFQCYLEFERKKDILFQLTVIVHELSSESTALFQTIKVMKESSRNLKKLASKSSEDVDKDEVNQLITEYEAVMKHCDIEFYYEEGREMRNKELRSKVDKLLKENETWEGKLEAIEEEIARSQVKIKKLNQRILDLKLKSLDVNSEMRLQLTSFPHFDQEQIQIVESLIS